MAYPTQTEQRYWTDVVKHEYSPEYCHDEITVANGSNAEGEPLKVLTLLGKDTATGKYVPYNPAASDGSEEAAGVLYSDDIDASAADVPAVALVRGPAYLVFEQLIFVNALNSAQQATAKQQLLALNIKPMKGV